MLNQARIAGSRVVNSLASRPVSIPAFSSAAEHFAEPNGLQDIDVSKLTVEKSESPKAKSPYQSLVFGREFSDHMLSIYHTAEGGWGAPKIHPYGPLSLDPSASVFHYGMELFEGMKAYKDAEGNCRLFRPLENMKRMNRSAERLCLPTFNPEQLAECIKELVKTDADWIPTEKGYSLYIRPTMIAINESLGVGPSPKTLLFVILSPVGPYYPEGFAPVTLKASQTYSRAFTGGTGHIKAGGNYGSTILPQVEAAKDGYSQVLWLGPNEEITEVGTMNMFVRWKNSDGEEELVTAPLDGTILPGVTRDSILSLTREWNEMKVSERSITMPELVAAIKEGRVVECFGAGTAAIVSPIKQINYAGVDYDIPIDGPDGVAGPLTTRIMDTILGIQYGEIEKPEWSVKL